MSNQASDLVAGGRPPVSGMGHFGVSYWGHRSKSHGCGLTCRKLAI